MPKQRKLERLYTLVIEIFLPIFCKHNMNTNANANMYKNIIDNKFDEEREKWRKYFLYFFSINITSRRKFFVLVVYLQYLLTGKKYSKLNFGPILQTRIYLE